MKILDDDLGHDPLQALAVGYARADVQADIPEAALEALREGPPSGARTPDVRADRDIEPLRLQQGPRQPPDGSAQRPDLLCCINGNYLRDTHPTPAEKVFSIPKDR